MLYFVLIPIEAASNFQFDAKQKSNSINETNRIKSVFGPMQNFKSTTNEKLLLQRLDQVADVNRKNVCKSQIEIQSSSSSQGCVLKCEIYCACNVEWKRTCHNILFCIPSNISVALEHFVRWANREKKKKVQEITYDFTHFSVFQVVVKYDFPFRFTTHENIRCEYVWCSMFIRCCQWSGTSNIFILFLRILPN